MVSIRFAGVGSSRPKMDGNVRSQRVFTSQTIQAETPEIRAERAQQAAIEEWLNREAEQDVLDLALAQANQRSSSEAAANWLEIEASRLQYIRGLQVQTPEPSAATSVESRTWFGTLKQVPRILVKQLRHWLPNNSPAPSRESSRAS